MKKKIFIKIKRGIILFSSKTWPLRSSFKIIPVPIISVVTLVVPSERYNTNSFASLSKSALKVASYWVFGYSNYLEFVECKSLASFNISYVESAKKIAGFAVGNNITTSSANLVKFTFKPLKKGSTKLELKGLFLYYYQQ